MVKSLRDLKTKKAIKDRVYKEVNPIINGIFHEYCWKPISEMREKLDEIGFDDVIVAPTNNNGCSGGYHYDNKYKQYDVKLTVNNIELNGNLTASFCGTVQDPMDAYDLTLVLF